VGILPGVISPTSRIRVERVDDSLAIVLVEGEHDLSSAAEFREHLSGLLEAGTSAVVDLSGATFVDSSVLAALIWASQQSAEQGVGFSVALPGNAAEGVRRVIDVTGLGEALALRDGTDAAVEAARTGAER
jgi:anti-sigma B factor antagonist